MEGEEEREGVHPLLSFGNDLSLCNGCNCPSIPLGHMMPAVLLWSSFCCEAHGPRS